MESEIADQRAIEYRKDPQAVMQQMQMRLLEMIGQSEMGVESILEDILSMPLERRLGFINWLGNSHDPRAANLLIPLLENQTSKIVIAVIDALEQLGEIASDQTIPALNYLIAHTANRQVKQYARTALGRLTMQSAPGTGDSTEKRTQPQQLQFHEARVSHLDGVGSQMIMLAWRRSDGLLKGVNVLYQDQWGIKDCYGTDEMAPGHWLELVSSMDDQGFGSFRVPLEFGRALIAEARAINKRTRRKIPIAYAIWRPFIEGEEAEEKDTPAVSTRLEPWQLSPEVVQLAQRGDLIYQMPEFVSWMYDPVERVQPYIDRYWTNRDLLDLSPFGSRSRKRKSSNKKQKAGLDIETLVSEAIGELVDNKWRALYEVRLLRQGALFQFVEREEDMKYVRAVAAVLHPDSGIPAQEQPFVRTMMRLSIEQGPFRAIAEALETARLETMPIDLFPEK